MRKSKLIISLLLGSYLLLLGHLSIPAVNDQLFENPVEHVHPGAGLCDASHDHNAKSHSSEDFHSEKPHHCIYCCGHNKSLEFTINFNNIKSLQLVQIISAVFEYVDTDQTSKTETNQIYLQNVFKLPVSDHFLLPIGLRAPPRV